ncbi:MAG TPA: thioredoxin domain-containing protein [Candidatus Saccharimonadales bacterium]|nr:thioredoxin domain-containing protein [Candidatus Saccharimonadales bacterium]
MSKKAWIIFAAACIVLLGGLIYISSKDKVDVSKLNTSDMIAASKQSGDIADHVFGNKDSKVIFIEYGDFQCPGCGSAYPIVKNITEKYKDQVAFVFRNFPLTNLHPNAKAAAAAAEAAGLQGKYWEMHDALYENQSSWKDLQADQRTDFFAGYANNFGLDVAKFKTDMASAKVTQKINFDIALGKKDKVSATPTLLLDGKPVAQDTWSEAAKLDKAFADVLKEKGIKLPKEDSDKDK